MSLDRPVNDRAARTAVAEHVSPLGSWRMEFLAPAAPLAPFVRRFNAYAERDTGFLRRRELPSPLATLVFNLGSDLRVEHPSGTSTTYRAGAAFYSGMSSTYAVTETDHAQEGAQVMLTTLGARRLIGFPLDEAGDQLIDPGDLFGAAARDLATRLQETHSPAGRLAILEEEMTRRLALSRAEPLPRSRLGVSSAGGDVGKHRSECAGEGARLQPKASDGSLPAGIWRYSQAFCACDAIRSRRPVVAQQTHGEPG